MDSDLMTLFEFDAEDLAANESGVLSVKQAEAFREANRGCNIYLVPIAILLLLIAAVLAAARLGVVTLPFLFDANAQGGAIGTWVGVGVMVVVALGILRVVTWKLDYSVIRVEGPARLVRRSVSNSEGSTSLVHELIIDKAILNISQDAFLALKEDEHYTVYYAKDMKKVLSIVRRA